MVLPWEHRTGVGQHQEDGVQATSAESQGNAKRLACTSKHSHWYILVLCMHSHRRRRSVLGYSLAVKPENADTYIQSGQIWLRLFTAEIKAEALIACVQTKDRKRSSNCEMPAFKSSLHLQFFQYQDVADGFFFKKKISLQNSSHSPWSRAPSVLSGFPSTSTHIQTLHNSF